MNFLRKNHRIRRDSTKQLRDIYDNYENNETKKA